MLDRHRRLGLLAGTLLLADQARAVSPGSVVDNFALLDQRGRQHELYYLSDMQAVAVMIHDADCSDMAAALAAFQQLQASYAGSGVEFLVLNVAGERSAVVATAAASGATRVPVLIDEARLVGSALGANRAGEVFLINPKGWRLAYRGPLTTTSSRNPRPLQAALDAVLAAAPVAKPQVAARGCRLSMDKPGQGGKRISYAKQIAPLLIDNCVTCHRAGGIGPFAMTDYNIVRGFAPMIREVIRTRRMPPWHADPHQGTFDNDRSLEQEEALTLVRWIEAGAPRGAGPDPLAQLRKTWPRDWALGEPDLVLETPAFDIPATGTIDYQRHTIKNPTGRDLWLRASEVLPGDRTVVHHVVVGMIEPNMPQRQTRLREGTPTHGLYVPGGAAFQCPPQTGVFIPKDGSLTLQMHYTSTGKATRDVTRLGLYFATEPPTYQLKTALLAKPSLRIPANTKDYSDSESLRTDRDVMIYSMFPHAHYRGRAASFTAQYPDGREDVLLSVPKYDFNWQTTYTLAAPKVIPAGTRITYTSSYDNSSQNRANPDPNREVPFGEQSWDEMLYGAFTYRELTPAQAAARTQ